MSAYMQREINYQMLDDENFEDEFCTYFNGCDVCSVYVCIIR